MTAVKIEKKITFAAMKGKLHLIPVPISESEFADMLPASVFSVIGKISFFVVEETRTARRFLSAAGLKGKIDGLSFFELNEHTSPEAVDEYVRILDNGNDVGLLSEAGLPAVADPGARLVALAHRHGIEVVPAVGPSSLMLALMASGMNGQCFAFCGYLPAKNDERRMKLKSIEKISSSARQTQIFIETPYRNDSMLKDILDVCRPETRLCIAADITLPEAYIKTRKVAEWKKENFVIGKRPCVFLLQA